MAIHIELVQYERQKYKAPDTAFINKHTGLEVGYGAYSKQGGFEVMGPLTNGIETFVSATMAYVELNNRLMDEYGY